MRLPDHEMNALMMKEVTEVEGGGSWAPDLGSLIICAFFPLSSFAQIPIQIDLCWKSWVSE
jgi:hypothetical protein